VIEGDSLIDVGEGWETAPPVGPFRDGKLYVLDEKCSTCIFRPGNLMHLREGTVEEMVQGCIEENTVIPCHQTLDGPRAVCRGLYDVHRREIVVLRMAAAFDRFAFEPPPEKT
jgi:hypothetical protein